MKNKKMLQIKILNENLVDDDTPYRMGLEKKHSLDAEVVCNDVHNAINLSFTTPLAMFEFAKSLMHEALFGNGWIEFNPYDFGNGPECVDGVRLVNKNTSIYASFPNRDDELTDEDLGIALSQ
jgi:hypothetical protein